MRRSGSTILFLLAAFYTLSGQVFPVDTLLWNGPADERINLVLIPDGYTDLEMDKFREDAAKILAELMDERPFREYEQFFNAVAILAFSDESGASHPGTATDVNEPVFPVANVSNRFGSRFDVGNIHRLLVPSRGGEIFRVLAESFPLYDQVMVLVNTPYYGGSGGTFATTSLHPSAPEIAIHEIGHSFAQLADEYWAGDQYARETHNMTSNTDPSTVRWKNWYGDEGVGIYQHCCGGRSSEFYRPHQDCKMRRLGPAFCPVCRERIIDRIYEQVDPIMMADPGDSEVLLFPGDSATFAINYLVNGQGSNFVDWQIDGTSLKRGDTLVLKPDDLGGTERVLDMALYDPTLFSRSYLPDTGYIFSRQWRVADCSGFSVRVADSLSRCFGDSILLITEGADRVNWQNGGRRDSVWVFGNGTYSVEWERGICRSFASVTVANFLPEFMTDKPDGPDQGMIGEAYGYRVAGDSSSMFTWEAKGGIILEGQGTDSVLIRWEDTPAEVCVEEIKVDGCSGGQRCLVVDVLFTGRKEYLPAIWGLSYGPNPVVAESLWIEADFPGNSPVYWALFDSGGRSVLDGILTPSGSGPERYTPQLAGLAPGVYRMRLYDGLRIGWISWVVQ